LRRSALGAIAAVLALSGCSPPGKVEQGRVIAYDPQARRVTLIREASTRSSPGILPPLTIETPTDPQEMGPAPAAGGLLLVDARNRCIVFCDPARQSFRTIAYTAIRERHNVAKSPGPAVVDRAAKTITLYAAKDHTLITFAASDDLLAMPADTWRAGDVIRFYYKDPDRALRLMNVTRTDLSKASG
jgi:hypothetical protein